ncbi:MAG: dynamin family protein [Gammaproteobacteria bacterium]|nr:dynamin family protein [Gammaproteobacteria bacterium]
MAGPDSSLVKRLSSLEHHLQKENPVLLGTVSHFKELDKVGYDTGLLETDDSYSLQIPWWPLVSILGTFSAGKSSFINSYLGVKLQKTGNQAVDDKFTVICYGEESAGKVLPGLALDSDLRFPFYKISDEIEKVAAGEGSRIDAYLQLKVSNSEAVNGKIIIDSPGFDADQQRTSTLRITDHIVDLSDLVLVFFDARHPEPGAMQDTLRHLVEDTINRSDSNKFLYILNQIDTAAREDNSEDVVSAWQRALSQRGLTAGRFYTIYNEDAALPFPSEELAKRFKSKRDHDLTEIMQRIEQVEVERAYRVVGALEKEAREIAQVDMPAVSALIQKWGRYVVIADSVIFGGLFLLILFLAISMGWLGGLATLILSFFTDPVSAILFILVMAGGFFAVHFIIRNKIAQRMLRKMPGTPDALYMNAFRKNTRFYRSVFCKKPIGWNKQAKATVAGVIEAASDFVQKLNDQFTNPSGKNGGAS